MKKVILLVLTSSLSAFSFGQSKSLETGKQLPYSDRKLSVGINYAIGNFYRLPTISSTKDFSGFAFGGIEIEKHLKNYLTLYIRSSLIINSSIPIPLGECFDDCEYANVWENAAGLRRNFTVGKKSLINLGLGISLNHYLWSHNYSIQSTTDFIKVKDEFNNTGIGFDSNINYFFRVGEGNINHFGIGFN